MDIYEYIWRMRVTCKSVADRLGYCGPLVQKRRRRDNGASLLFGLKMHRLSNGKVPLEKILSEKEEKIYKDWLKNLIKEEEENA